MSLDGAMAPTAMGFHRAHTVVGEIGARLASEVRFVHALLQFFDAIVLPYHHRFNLDLDLRRISEHKWARHFIPDLSFSQSKVD